MIALLLLWGLLATLGCAGSQAGTSTVLPTPVPEDALVRVGDAT